MCLSVRIEQLCFHWMDIEETWYLKIFRKAVQKIQVDLKSNKNNFIQHFNNQLAHATLKNVELLKHFKIIKTASTCFGLQGNHHQVATIST